MATWEAVRNTERTAQSKFGKVWQVLEERGNRTLIEPLGRLDLRWIFNDQITKRFDDERN
jgi:hypothetical protein